MTAPRICAVIYGILAIIMMCGIAVVIWQDIRRDSYYRSTNEIFGVFGSIAVLGILWPVSAGDFFYVWLSTRNKEE